MSINRWSTPSDLGPEYELLWPPEIFHDEVQAIVQQESPSNLSQMGFLLLEEAFADDAVSRDFVQCDTGSSWIPDHTKLTPVEFLQFLMLHSDLLHQKERTSPYWLDRNGVVAVTGLSPVRSLQQAWVSMVQGLIAKGYLSKIAPRPCVDDEYERSSVDNQLDVLIAKRLGVSDLWHKVKKETINADYLYALFEVFHDLVSRPRKKHFHEFSNCGWEFEHQVLRTGQRVYRWRVNALLLKYEVDLEIANAGENIGRLVRRLGDPRAELVSQVIETPDMESNDPVKHAIALFEKRNATRSDKRSACVALALILEQRRKLLKRNLLSKDEGMLFDIANNFDLRHRDGKHHSDYADDYLDWIFWIYLSTIELSNRLIKTQLKNT